MAEIASPISGGIQAVRRTVSSSIFTGAGVVQGNTQQQDNNSRLLSRNSLQLSMVTSQLTNISFQVINLNASLKVLKDNLEIQASLDRQRAAAQDIREAQLAEEGLREGKESVIENKIRNNLLGPVQKLGQKLQGILGRVTGFLSTLLVGWLSSTFIDTINAIATGNFIELRKVFRNTAKILLAVGGIVLISRFGVGGIIGGLVRFGRNLRFLKLGMLLTSPFKWIKNIALNVLKFVAKLVPWIMLGTPFPGEGGDQNEPPPEQEGDDTKSSDDNDDTGDVQPRMFTPTTNLDILTDVERKRPKREEYEQGSDGDVKYQTDLDTFKEKYDSYIRKLISDDKTYVETPDFDPKQLWHPEDAIVKIGKELFRLNEDNEIEGKYKPFTPPAVIEGTTKNDQIAPVNKKRELDKTISDNSSSQNNINVLPVEVDESTDVPDGSLVNGEAVGWPVIKATNSFNTFVYIAYHQFNIVPVLA
tara:strand:+ start:2951 stop:4375 length:1425 start_codon:yes stop_codon:yes gene_type:complete